MSLFLRKIALFSILLLGLILLFIYSSSSIILRKSNLFEISNNRTTLFLGHSHVTCSVNDSIVEKSINLASGGEAYVYTYLKLEQILRHNPHINHVILGFSNNQISSRMDTWAWELPFCEWSFPKYFFNSTVKENSYFFKKNPKLYLRSLRLGIKENLKMLIHNKNLIDSKKWGGYKGFLRRLKNSATEKESDNEKMTQISQTNIEYLEKCIDLCSTNSVKVSLYRSPLLSHHPFLKNELLFQSIIREKFSEINFIDLKEYKLEIDEFSDSGHINKNGAQKTSTYLNLLLNPKK